MRRRWPRAAGLALLGADDRVWLPAALAGRRARGKPFWLALARDCAVPAGESAFGLVSEAVSLLGSPDTEWRDDVGYGVVAACVYQKKLLKPEERRALVARLSANLRRGIGETGTDSVLLRSFSALDLSILAALENATPRSTRPAIGGCSTTRSRTCATSATCAASSRAWAGSTPPRTPPTC